MSTYSFHTFMFPFRWKIKDLDNRPFSEQIDLNNIRYAEPNNWDRVTKTEAGKESDDLYNERNYFYEFVHPALYDNNSEHSIIRHFERREPKHGGVTYCIVCGDKNHPEKYTLDVQAINLNLYSTGVGVLSIYLYNNRYPDPKAVLSINQYGRRVFPPFIADVEERIELSHSIGFNGLNGVYEEDFNRYNNGVESNTPASFITKMVHEVAENIELQSVIDDRMFVLCWYKNDEWTKEFETDYNNFINNNKNWYEFVFVDKLGGLSCQNDTMRRKLIKNATYARWQQNCSLYGVSRYSMVFLTNSATDIFAPFLFPYFETEYARMAELVFMQRATVLRFSSEITHISNMSLSKDFGARVSSLYKEYIRFENQIYFREVSAQDQGIEMYQLLFKAVNLEDQVKKLDEEIEELYNYVSLNEDRRTNRTMSLLTWITTIFLPVTVTTGFFAMTNYVFDGKTNQHLLLQILILICFSLIVILTTLTIKNKKIK